MRDFKLHNVGTVVVHLALKADKSCEITTTAAHAGEILRGDTSIPPKIATVFDRCGKRLSKIQVASLEKRDCEEKKVELVKRKGTTPRTKASI